MVQSLLQRFYNAVPGIRACWDFHVETNRAKFFSERPHFSSSMQRIGRERSGSAGANLADVAQRWNSKHALKIRFVFSILISIGVLGFSACREEAKPGVVIKKPAGSQSSANTGKQLAPAYVYEVLSYVKKKGMAPDNFTGGRVFENRERRLPQRTASGATIGYREWDVHPKVRGQNRGAERLVTGSDQSAWYTANHYKSFIRLE